MVKSEKLEFQTEVSQLLKLMINSVYSEKEVFVRELVSNASDACDKLRYLATTKEKLLQDDPELKINIEIDKKSNLITIADNGIGMNRNDLVNNLGTIARSGTAQFIKEASKTKDLSLIGQFGVGFYSAFMVATDVKVITRKAGEKKLWIWKSVGESNFTIEESENLDQLDSNRVTKILLSINKDNKEYLEKIRIEAIIRKYSDHISIPIFVKDSKDKIEDKDNFNIQFKEKEFLKSIDLHGYTLDQANETICQFIEKCYYEGTTRINVITGKGLRSKNKEDPFKSNDLSILKYSVPNFIKNNSELMKKIKMIDFDSVNSSLKGSFDIILKKKL